MPYNSQVVPDEKYDPAALKRWGLHQEEESRNVQHLQEDCIEVAETDAINMFAAVRVTLAP